MCGQQGPTSVSRPYGTCEESTFSSHQAHPPHDTRQRGREYEYEIKERLIRVSRTWLIDHPLRNAETTSSGGVRVLPRAHPENRLEYNPASPASFLPFCILPGRIRCRKIFLSVTTRPLAANISSPPGRGRSREGCEQGDKRIQIQSFRGDFPPRFPLP